MAQFIAGNILSDSTPFGVPRGLENLQLLGYEGPSAIGSRLYWLILCSFACAIYDFHSSTLRCRLAALGSQAISSNSLFSAFKYPPVFIPGPAK